MDATTGEIIKPPHVIVYAEEAHTLLPKSSEDDNTNIWARIAKEGAKFNIGMVYSTQEPSSIQTNILKNTENWFIAHLNNTDETNQLSKFNDFKDFANSILNVSEVGLIKMRTRSNYFTIPVQMNKFEAPPPLLSILRSTAITPVNNSYRSHKAESCAVHERTRYRRFALASGRKSQRPGIKGSISVRSDQMTYSLPPTIKLARRQNPIRRIIAVDGSTITKAVQNGFPRAEAALFNAAVIVIKVDELAEFDRDRIPSPSQLRDLEKVETMSAVLPGQNVVGLQPNEDTPKKFYRHTVRQELDFRLDESHESLLETFTLSLQA